MPFSIGEILERITARQKRYDASIDAEDDLGAIIRGLTYIDDSLRSLLRWRIKKPEAIDLHRMHGWRLVCLAEALGLIEHSLAISLKHFIELRNAFGHKLEREITDEDVNRIVGSFTGDIRDEYGVLLGQHADKDTVPGRLRLAIRSLNMYITNLDINLMNADLNE